MVHPRLLAAALVALFFAGASVLGLGGPRSATGSDSFAAALYGQRPSTTAYADDADNGDDDDADNGDEDEDADNGDDDDADNSDDDDADNSDDDDDADNDDADADNDDADADNDDAEQGDDGDNAASGDSAVAPAALPIESAELTQPLAEATGVSTGGDVLVATPGERVAIRIFSWMPAGIQVTIRPVDPATLTVAPGTVPAVTASPTVPRGGTSGPADPLPTPIAAGGTPTAGGTTDASVIGAGAAGSAAGGPVALPSARVADLAFVVEARDASGAPLSALPAEVNLAIRYADSAVAGLNEDALTLARLDPATGQWQTAPKLVKEATSNYLAASVTALGTYLVYAQQ